MSQGFSGILNVNKPSGVTSRRVVDIVQRLGRKLKAGHAGTLDPLASGVLIVCVGAATRLIEYVQRMPKRYDATFLLGRSSPTEDTDGEVTLLPDAPEPTLEQLREAAGRFLGEIQQRPPAFSALKVEGRRAYALARKGEAVDLEPRPVTIYGIEIVAYDYPTLRLQVECGSGTYIRSLGRDLAATLGTAAVMSQLIRTAIGSFRVEDAVAPDALTPEAWTEHLLPARGAVEVLPQVTLSDADVTRVRYGQNITGEFICAGQQEIAALDGSGNLIGILIPREPGLWRPAKILPDVSQV